MIIRDRQTGRIVCAIKHRPIWATEDGLRHQILMPALRHLTAAQQYFREGRSAGAIAKELGVSPASVRNYIYRIRRAVGAPKEPLREVQPERLPTQTSNALWQSDLHATGKGRVQRSAGRKLADTWANNDSVLQEVVLGPSLLILDVARRYWLMDHSARQIAVALGMKRKAVQYITEMVRYRAEHPHLEQRVYLARTRAGKDRRGRTILA